MSQLVELTVEECLSLLRSRVVGRIAMQTPGGLRVFPVNYAMVDDQPVFRTLPYGVIANHAHEAEVAFEVDDLDDQLHAGWSVLAVGTCRRVADPDEVRLIRQEMDPLPWAEGQRILYFRVEWVDVTGRQVGLADRPSLIPATRRPEERRQSV